MIENRVLWRIFEPKMEEKTGGWRTLQNEELHNLYSQPNITEMINSRKIIWAEHVSLIREEKCEVLVVKSERMRPLERPRRGWDINMELVNI
jgi:hypothetical protein